MLKLIHDDQILKEYEDNTIFLIFNRENAELIGSSEHFDDPERAANLHAALAFHWALAHKPELVAQVLKEFDDHVVEEVKPTTETVQ